MPEDAETTAATEETTETLAEETAEPGYEFPFVLPDLAQASEEELRSLHAQVREHASSLAGSDPADASEDALIGLRACRDLAVEIADELGGRADEAAVQAERVAEAQALAAELGGLTLPDPEPEPTPDDPPPAVTASTRRAAPRARDVARRTTAAPQLPQEASRGRASMTASSDFAGFHTGQQLQSFKDAARILAARIDQYPSAPVARGRINMAKRPITVYDPEQPGRTLLMKQFSRHQGVQIRREFPADLRVTEANVSNGWAVAEHAASERRLPGSNLVQSMALSMKAKPGRALTAAAGWCAPSDIMYDLLELETLEGMLDAPELETPRGGWQIPVDGGPDFASIYTAIGNSGDTHLTEAEVIADTSKVCVEIPCPDFEEVRLGVDYVCITGSLLQRRGYPEAVARFTRGAMIALAHKINAGFIAALVADSTAVILGSDPAGDDAASSLLAAVELAALDVRYRHRMGQNSTVEVVLPFWALAQVRAALSRRTGVALVNVSNAQILEWFGDRGAVPHFVYDWQDQYTSGAAGTPGGATPTTGLPTLVQMLVYPAGTWVKAVQDVIDLDTIYDSTNLATNQYTAVFSETGWAPLKMGPVSRVYTVPLDPSGVTGCCPGEEIS